MTHLPETVEAYLKQSGMTASAFGRAAMKDPNFVFRLRSGCGWHSNTPGKIQQYIEENPPQGGEA